MVLKKNKLDLLVIPNLIGGKRDSLLPCFGIIKVDVIPPAYTAAIVSNDKIVAGWWLLTVSYSYDDSQVISADDVPRVAPRFAVGAQDIELWELLSRLYGDDYIN